MSFRSKHLNCRYISYNSNSRAQNLLILAHGRGGRLPLLEFIAKRKKIEAMDCLCIEAPHGEFVPEMRVPGFSWYVSPNELGLAESHQKLDGLFEEIFEWGFSSSRIFWMGFSQGGVMGLERALKSSFKMAGVINVSGFCLRYEQYPKAFGPHALSTPILLTHGSRDKIVSLESARKSYRPLIDLGVRIDFWEFDKPHTFDMKNEVPKIESWIRDRI